MSESLNTNLNEETVVKTIQDAVKIMKDFGTEPLVLQDILNTEKFVKNYQESTSCTNSN